MGHQIFRASRLTFEALARERPTVLVFEDFHWADQSSEALLKHLLPLVESAPLLLCCPTRPDPVPPGARFCARAGEDHPGRYTEVVLNQLSPAETAELVRNLLAVELSPRLRQIFARGEGNPFFLEEVVRSLIDMGAFERDEASGRWQVVTSIDEITIPDTIQGVIMARIDRLDEEAEQVLRAAPVIRRASWPRTRRRSPTTSRPWTRTRACSASAGTRSSAPCWNARSARRSSAGARTISRSSVCSARSSISVLRTRRLSGA